MMGGFTSILTGYFLYIAVGFLVVPFLVVYVLEDVAGRRSGNRDHFLGTKVWLTFLMSVSGQVFLSGAALLLALVLDEDLSRQSDAWKTAWGLIVGGALASLYPIVIYRAYLQREESAAIFRRAAGINGFLTGTTFTVALVVTVVLVFKTRVAGKGSPPR